MADASSALGLRERKKRRSRETILTAAMALFRQRGYDDVTVEEVAVAAEVSTRTVYHYFSAKEDLVLQFHASALDELVQAIHEAPKRASAVDILAAAMVEGMDHEHQSLASTRFEIMNRSPALQMKLRGRRAMWAEKIAEALVERGHFGGDRALATLFGRCVVSATETAVEAYIRDPAGGDIAHRLRDMFDVLGAGFGRVDSRA
jgi:AcrR family transcriptional regulator